jgi:hypothetical protein
MQCQNAADWYALVQAFGTKQFNSGGSFTMCALLNMGCDSYDLPTAIRSVLTSDELATINSYFSNAGIGITL